MLQSQLDQFLARPIEFFGRRGREVESADHRMDLRFRAHGFLSVLERIDQSRVSAPRQNDEPFGRIKNHRHVFGHIVRPMDITQPHDVTGSHRRLLGVRAIDWAGQPNSRVKLNRFIGHNHFTTELLVIFTDRYKIIPLPVPHIGTPRPQGATAHMHPREGVRIFLRPSAAQRDQPTGMIAVVVRKNHISDFLQ